MGGSKGETPFGNQNSPNVNYAPEEQSCQISSLSGE